MRVYAGSSPTSIYHFEKLRSASPFSLSYVKKMNVKKIIKLKKKKKKKALLFAYQAYRHTNT